MNLDEIALRLEALGNPTRLRICRELIKAGNEGLLVGELQKRIDIAGSTLTHHIQKLSSNKVLTQERKANSLICKVDFNSIKEISNALLEECCNDSIENDDKNCNC